MLHHKPDAHPINTTLSPGTVVRLVALQAVFIGLVAQDYTDLTPQA
jgi:hypothetical protein